jgi:hypothetical protein
MNYSVAGKDSALSFNKDGTFYNHSAEIEGTWTINSNPQDYETPDVVLTYPEHKIEGTFKMTDIMRDWPYTDGIVLTCN